MAALEVLPDLLRELDETPPAARLTALVEGCLAANIFDWGAKACVDLYHNGTILEIYRCVGWAANESLQQQATSTSPGLATGDAPQRLPHTLQMHLDS